MADLTLELLGGYHGRLGDGRELTLPTKKGWALLAYLALHPDKAVNRETLATLLWGERFDEQARGSLRQTLYELRTAFGDSLADSIGATRTTVSLNSDSVSVDAVRFEELTMSGDPDDLAKAEALYQGLLLEGLETGEPAFTEWLEGIRARYQTLACHALETWSTLKTEAGDYEGAIVTARRLVEIEPLSEPAHRILMRALAGDGRRSEALKHYQEVKKLLQAELGVEPDAETQELRGLLMARSATGATRSEDDLPGDTPVDVTTTPQGFKASGMRWRRWRPRAVMVSIALALGVGLLVWQPWMPAIQPALLQDMAYPLPDKPSIAVLPFENFSGESADAFIAKGFTEDLITALSKLPQLFVISRITTFAFHEKTVTAAEIAEELGVRYIVKGSVQRSGDMLRINAQLVDAVEGNHLWADNFDGEANNLFALQDDIVRRILIELQVKLTDGDHARVASRGTSNLDAWLLRQQAMAELYKFTRESTIRTRELLQAARDLDPNWARPLAGIAWSYWWEARRGWSDDREEWIRKGIELAEQAIEMDPNDTLGYMQLGNLYQLKGDHERAIELREKAVDIAPNDFQANWGLGAVLFRAGQVERAVQVLKHAERVSPRHPASFTWTLSWAQMFAGHYEDSIETASLAKKRAPDRDGPRIPLAAGYSALGRMEEAKREAQELLRIDPKFSVSDWKSQLVDYKDRAMLEKVASLLVQAGLPE